MQEPSLLNSLKKYNETRCSIFENNSIQISLYALYLNVIKAMLVRNRFIKNVNRLRCIYNVYCVLVCLVLFIMGILIVK